MQLLVVLCSSQLPVPLPLIIIFRHPAKVPAAHLLHPTAMHVPSAVPSLHLPLPAACHACARVCT
jgi:hypothetical protein